VLEVIPRSDCDLLLSFGSAIVSWVTHRGDLRQIAATLNNR
jgi:hypothetical protein